MVIRVVVPSPSYESDTWHHPKGIPPLESVAREVIYPELHDWKGVFWIDDGIAVHF